MLIKALPPTLSGVDEKPHKRSPDIYRLSGLFVLLHVDRSRLPIGYKVAEPK